MNKIKKTCRENNSGCQMLPSFVKSYRLGRRAFGIFSFNAFGARVSKTDSSGTATYARNGESVVAPVLTDGSLTFTPGISSNDGNDSTFSHGDIKNSLRQTAENESTSATKQYDAFGNETTSTGAWQGPFQYGGPFGYQTDFDSGLKLLGHRYYDSSTGRFLSRDRIKDGQNWYSYVRNNPIRFGDPLGLAPVPLMDPVTDGIVDTGVRRVTNPGSGSVGLEFTLDGVWEGVKTGLAGIGSAATLGFWDGGEYKHKPGFGVSKVFAYIGLTALTLAIGGATGVIAKGAQLAASGWNRLFGGFLRIEKNRFTWKGVSGPWGKVDLWHAHLFGGSRHLLWETRIVTAAYLYARRLLHSMGRNGAPLVPPLVDPESGPTAAPLLELGK